MSPEMHGDVRNFQPDNLHLQRLIKFRLLAASKRVIKNACNRQKEPYPLVRL